MKRATATLSFVLAISGATISPPSSSVAIADETPALQILPAPAPTKKEELRGSISGKIRWEKKFGRPINNCDGFKLFVLTNPPAIVGYLETLEFSETEEEYFCTYRISQLPEEAPISVYIDVPYPNPLKSETWTGITAAGQIEIERQCRDRTCTIDFRNNQPFRIQLKPPNYYLSDVDFSLRIQASAL